MQTNRALAVAFAMSVAGFAAACGSSSGDETPSSPSSADDDDDGGASSIASDTDAGLPAEENTQNEDTTDAGASGEEEPLLGSGGSADTGESPASGGTAPGSGGAPTGTGGAVGSGGAMATGSGGALLGSGGAMGTGGAGVGGSASGVGGDTGSVPSGSAGAAGAYAASAGAAAVDEEGGAGEGPGAAGAGGAAPEDPPISLATNPFTLTSFDPLSTFAADTDTASYDIFRQYVTAGLLPSPTTVRLEEYVNYFTYAYPAPAYDDEVPFSISLAAAPNILDRETVMLRVGIQGKAAPPFEKRPANLVFLVDVSGSMSSTDKLPLVQEVLRLTLDELDPTDTISIVTYASSTGVRLPPTPVSDRAAIEEVIDGLTAGGSTAGGAGITLAYEQAEAAFIEDGVNHVLLCTDGDFNVGTSSTDELVALIEEKRETGVTLTALGFGMNSNDEMMEAVTNAGNGVYGVITDSDQAATYVQERLLQGMTYIAKDMKIQVEFNPNEVYAYRLLGYENRAIADQLFRDDTVDAGEVGAGHRVTALYELVMPGVEIPLPQGAPPPENGEPYSGEVEVSADDLVLVKVRYKHLDDTADDPALEVATTLAPADVGESYTALDGDFQWAVVIASFAEILKESPYADPSQLDLMDQIIAGPDHAEDPDRAEFVTLFGTARGLLGQ